MKVKEVMFKTILFGLLKLLKRTAKSHTAFKEHLKKHDITVQIKLRDNSTGRYYTFKGGKISSKSGIHMGPVR